jgi:predicted nucleic acid-binding protein
MKRLFLDSSVLFAAARATASRTGHARDLILMAVRGEIILIVSQLVLEETRRNLAESAPERLAILDYVTAGIPFELIKPTKREVIAAAKRVVLKDAPILAAARKARVDYLVTLDKKHLLGKPELTEYVRAPIITPQEAFERLPKPD